MSTASGVVGPARAAERRIHRAWSDDGLAEIFGGIWFLASASLLFAPIPFTVALFAFVLLGFSTGRVLVLSKRALVDRRSGLVRLRPFKATRRHSVLLAIVGGTVGAVAGVLESVFPTLPPLVPLAFFLTLPAGFVVTAWQTRLPRHMAGAVVAMLVTIPALAVQFLGEESRLSWEIFTAGMGAWLLVSGLVVFLAYLRAHPSLPPSDRLGG